MIHQASKNILSNVTLGDEIISGEKVLTGDKAICLNRGVIEKLDNGIFKIRKDTLEGEVEMYLSKDEIKAILNWML